MNSSNFLGLISAEVIEKVEPHLPSIFDKVSQGKEFRKVAQEIAIETNLSVVQVARYVHAVILAAEENPKKKR